MGNQASQVFDDSQKDSKPHRKCSFDQNQPLKPQQIKNIKSTWGIVKQEMGQIGMLAFLHLFEAHPEAKTAFKVFEDIETDDLKTNEIFRNHAHRVVFVIKKVVTKIDEPAGYLNYLKILGAKHIIYEADVKYIKQMGYMFLSAIQPTLEKEKAWNEETRDAWESLLMVVVETMEIAITQGED